MSGDDSKSSSGKIAIIVALIGLLGTLLPVLIVNWKTIFPKGSTIAGDTANTSKSRVDTMMDTIKVSVNNLPADSSSKTDNEKGLTKQWYNYLIAKNSNGLISVSFLPFFGYRMIEDNNSLIGFYNRLAVKLSGVNKIDNVVIINKVDFYNMYPQLKPLINVAFEPEVVQITLDNAKIFLLFHKTNTLKIVGCYAD